ncbi:DUF2939 domain-containing protein [Cyanobium sp. WAJ14-Wanaka]|uniref:DUF2939 domain-containing protein n=1 Tax=Cyanobium sp. WAJ14-Wanaka TaxID=2823725 RepID=UPI0020CFB4D0|nr:DUF2939 domain-containing protein [Cyanobium sp. WAJ14-Wanaka]MCP9774019.1 DUF2939 domain-containing protein [Cyanobium sp. WAJ14-Wanaka]
MQGTNHRLVALALGTAATIYGGSPIFALADCGLALAQGNGSKVSSYIDFPALRSSLKGEARQVALYRLSGQQQPGANPLLGLANLVMGPVVDAAVEGLATPDGIRARVSQQADQNPRAAGSADSPWGLAQLLASTSMGYSSPNRFVVRLKDRQQRPLALTLARQGLVGWKLVAIDLPPDGRFEPS